MSKTLNGCFAGIVAVSLTLCPLARWIGKELLLVYNELLGGADLPAVTGAVLQHGHWLFLGHAFAVAVSWGILRRRECREHLALPLLLGFATIQIGFVVVIWIGSVLPLFTITWHLGLPV